MVSSDRLKQAIEMMQKRRANYEFFFNRVDSPDWIEPLRASGLFFVRPPEPKRDGDSISFPMWPESKYLVRMASLAAPLVLDLFMSFPETDNPRIIEDMVEAALRLPPELASTLVSRVSAWMNKHGYFYVLDSEPVGRLIQRLAEDGYVGEALNLARAVLAIDPTGNDALSRARPRFSYWSYQQVLTRYIPKLAAVDALKTLELLCDLLERAVTFRRSEEEATQGRSIDYSFIWRPAVEDHQQNSSNTHVDNELVTAIRDTAYPIVNENAGLLEQIVQLMEAREWPIFRRLALYLLSQFPELSVSLATERLFRDDLDNSNIVHEYAILLKSTFSLLSNDSKESLLDRVEQGPPTSKLTERLQTAYGRAPTDKELTDSVDIWKRDKLALFPEELPDGWADKRRELFDRMGEPGHPDLPYTWSMSWGHPESPMSLQQMEEMTVIELMDQLTSWRPSDDPRNSGVEELAGELGKFIDQRAPKVALEAMRFTELSAWYVRAFLMSLTTTIAQEPIVWGPVLQLGRFVANHADSMSNRDDEATVWNWAKDSLLDLIDRGLHECPGSIPSDEYESVWAILTVLIDHPNPDLTYESESADSNFDPLTLAINSTRGKALIAVISYGRRLKEIQDAAASQERLDAVRTALARHLDPHVDAVASTRSIYGWYFPSLVAMDPEWAFGLSGQIFPKDADSRLFWDAAWGAYITGPNVFRDVFNGLRDEYMHAIDLIGSHSKGRISEHSDGRLADHIILMYFWGHLQLSDELLVSFFETADDETRGEAIDFAGRIQQDFDVLEPEVQARLGTLWEWRLSVSEPKKKQHEKELASFGSWFWSQKMNVPWLLENLRSVLKLIGYIEPSSLVVDNLEELAAQYPVEAVSTLYLMIEGAKETWSIPSWHNEITAILSTAKASGEADALSLVTDTVNLLGAKGYFDFGSLIADR